MVQKCIPNVPRCKRCTDLGIEECVYVQKKKRVVRDLLRVGEACFPCRLVRDRMGAGFAFVGMSCADLVHTTQEAEEGQWMSSIIDQGAPTEMITLVEVRRQTPMLGLRRCKQNWGMRLRRSEDVPPSDEEDSSGAGETSFSRAQKRE